MTPEATWRWFRALALAEAASSVALFFVALPVNYVAGVADATAWAGWFHGALFLTYLVALWSTGRVLRWSWGTVVLGSLAAFPPLGTLCFEPRVQPSRGGWRVAGGQHAPACTGGDVDQHDVRLHARVE